MWPVKDMFCVSCCYINMPSFAALDELRARSLACAKKERMNSMEDFYSGQCLECDLFFGSLSRSVIVLIAQASPEQ